MMEARKKEYIRTRTEKRKAEHEAIVELAKTDEEATNQLEWGRQMNDCVAQTEEVINDELIYC